jgi:hypothetical protein
MSADLVKVADRTWTHLKLWARRSDGTAFFVNVPIDPGAPPLTELTHLERSPEFAHDLDAAFDLLTSFRDCGCTERTACAWHTAYRPPTS